MGDLVHGKVKVVVRGGADRVSEKQEPKREDPSAGVVWR